MVQEEFYAVVTVLQSLLNFGKALIFGAVNTRIKFFWGSWVWHGLFSTIVRFDTRLSSENKSKN